MKISLISALILLTAVLAVPNSATAQESGDPLYTAELGVQAYTFRHQFEDLGVEATLDIIQKMGFTELEGGPAGMEPEKFRRLCEDRGISIPSTGTGYGQLVENPAAVAETAKALGARYVMTAWIPHDGDSFTIEHARKAVDDFNKAGKVLKENGITFAYHVHGYEFRPNPRGEGTLMDYIIRNTDPDYVAFELDILWAHFGGADPVQLLKTYPDRFVLLHVKDLRKGTEKDNTGLTDPDNDVALGTGEIDVEGVIRQANKIGIKHFFIEDESSRVLTQVPKSIEYLKSLRK